MKKLSVFLLMCLLLSFHPAAKDGDILYNTEVKLTRLHTSCVIYPVFDEDGKTREVKSAAYELERGGAEYILERAVRDSFADCEYLLCVDSTVSPPLEGTIKVTLTMNIYKNGVTVNMDTRILHLYQHREEITISEI